jgi:FkbM family methyltransferase
MAPPISVPEQRALLDPGLAASLVARLRARLAPVLTRRRHTTLVRFAVACSSQIVDMAANVNFDIAQNGELEVLSRLRGTSPACVLDVGANVGDWSERAAAMLPTAHIHAFEIVPETAEELRRRLERAGLLTVTVNAIGLSDESGTVRVAHLPGFAEGSSAAVVQPLGPVQWLDCPVTTGDTYCAEHGIEHIDVLKLDVEGLEGRVLAGFEGMLSRRAVDVVQFEYGPLNASVRFLLGDFHELFARHGYAVGKIYPDGVEFRGFDAWQDENFRGPNYLAVRADRGDLLRLLATAHAQ